jgi:hypothetical protein
MPWHHFQSIPRVVNALATAFTARARAEQGMRLTAATQELQEKLSYIMTPTETQRLDARRHDPPNPYQEERPLDIITVLRRSVKSKCSLTSDRVYGLLGLTSVHVARPHETGRTVNTLEIDYQKPAAEVFQDLTRYCIRRDGCLGVLQLSARFGGIVDDVSLPSWTIDWRLPTSRDPWLAFKAPVPLDAARVMDGSSVLAVEGHQIGVLWDNVQEARLEVIRTLPFLRLLQASGESSAVFDAACRGLVDGQDLVITRRWEHGEGWTDFTLMAAGPVLDTKHINYFDDVTRVLVQEAQCGSPDGEVVATLWPGHLIIGRPRLQTFYNMGSDVMLGTKHMKVSMRTGPSYPDFNNQPDYTNSRSELLPSSDSSVHVSLWIDGDEYSLLRAVERSRNPNRLRAFKVEEDGMVHSTWTVPKDAEPGDQLIMCSGSHSLAMVIRQVDAETASYQYVGAAIIDEGSWVGESALLDEHDVRLRGWSVEEEGKIFPLLREWLLSEVGMGGWEEFNLV